MFLDFIEIGTSDFNTEIQKKDNKIGISIEPISYYIDKLPNKEGCKKIQNAISNCNDIVKVFYINNENIDKYKLPDYTKGCNSINDYHPTIKEMFKRRNLDIEKIATSYDVKCKTLMTIINENDVDGIYYLKIDTEGHDTVILKKFYEDICDNKHLPHTILFESNRLSNIIDINNIIELYKSKGYDLITTGHDTFMKLNLHNIMNKCKFTEPIKNYYINDYPTNYHPNNLPHKNTLDDAKKYCIENNCSGITYQNNRYEVRNGKYITYFENNTLISWIYI